MKKFSVIFKKGQEESYKKELEDLKSSFGEGNENKINVVILEDESTIEYTLMKFEELPVVTLTDFDPRTKVTTEKFVHNFDKDFLNENVLPFVGELEEVKN